jgi:hypothetical protein
MIDPEQDLNEAERAALASYVQTPGFHAWHKLMQIECAKFDLALKNTNPADRESVLAAHVMSKAASQFFAGLLNRVNEEVSFFLKRHEAPQVLDSPTDQIFEEM